MYPTNIKLKKISKARIIKEKLVYLKNKLKRIFKYIVFDRTNLSKRIKIKLHI